MVSVVGVLVGYWSVVLSVRAFSFTPWLWGRFFCAGYLDSGACSHGLLYLRYVGH
eukprot:COSAG05_NODE_1538_length_4607_cov_185.303904_2_plen_55_part_00